jgi:NAD(P)-dependent dehydrogenase (short-subunit alcohol dehydrogenase family)
MPESATTVLITGATDGLGRALAHRLAAQGAHVILHGRDQGRLEATAAEIAQQSGRRRPDTVLADFADLGQVRNLSKQVGELTDRLDVLVNNAGIGSGEPAGRERAVSADGFELRFAVNYLAGFDLTLRLLPLLRAAAQNSAADLDSDSSSRSSSGSSSTSGSTSGSGSARIVNVASLGQAPIEFDDVMIEHGYSGTRAYGQSKLAQITAGFVLADRLQPDRITVNSLHPSTYMPTKMVLQEIGHSIDTLEDGEEATRRLVDSPELDGVTGKFFDRTREARANASAYHRAVQKQLWKLSLDLTGAPDVS